MTYVPIRFGDAILFMYVALAIAVMVVLAAARVATAIDARGARRPFSAWAASFLLFGEAAYTAGLAAGGGLGPLVALACAVVTVAPAVFILRRHPLAMHVAVLGQLAALVPAAGLAMRMDSDVAAVYLVPLVAVMAVTLLLTRSFLRKNGL